MHKPHTLCKNTLTKNKHSTKYILRKNSLWRSDIICLIIWQWCLLPRLKAVELVDTQPYLPEHCGCKDATYSKLKHQEMINYHHQDQLSIILPILVLWHRMHWHWLPGEIVKPSGDVSSYLICQLLQAAKYCKLQGFFYRLCYYFSPKLAIHCQNEIFFWCIWWWWWWPWWW